MSDKRCVLEESHPTALTVPTFQCTTFATRPSNIQGGGGLGDYFARENFVGGKFGHFPNCKSSNCLTRTLTCKPGHSSESERSANPIATCRRFRFSKHVPQNYGPKVCCAIGIFTALATPLNFATGKICHLP